MNFVGSLVEFLGVERVIKVEGDVFMEENVVGEGSNIVVVDFDL